MGKFAWACSQNWWQALFSISSALCLSSLRRPLQQAHLAALTGLLDSVFTHPEVNASLHCSKMGFQWSHRGSLCARVCVIDYTNTFWWCFLIPGMSRGQRGEKQDRERKLHLHLPGDWNRWSDPKSARRASTGWHCERVFARMTLRMSSHVYPPQWQTSGSGESHRPGPCGRVYEAALIPVISHH